MILILFIMVSDVFISFSQINPAPPQTEDVITCFPDTAGYEVITVGPVDRDYSDLQSAINAASLGTILVLDAGAEFYGGFQLPDKGDGDEWIILISSRMDLLPNDELPINPDGITGHSDFPTQQDAMPKIITDNLSGIPCFQTLANAHHYRFVGLEIKPDTNVINSYGLVNLGSSSSGQNNLSVVPHHFVIDRCFIHGHTNGMIMKYGVRLDCANAAIIDSYISDFHSIGFDAQAISGINGPGPFKIINNYLEASGENILIGGGAPAIPGLVPSDIEIRQNYFFKPYTWRLGHSTYAGKHWTIKNLFELKTGRRVLFDGNVLENCWADLPVGQSGYAILLTVRTENGNSPQADVSDVVISNNIIRHVGAGISLSGMDDGAGNRSSRIKICNNLFDDINGPAYGDQNVFGPNDGTFLKIGEPQDVWVDHNTIFQTGPITWAYDITDNFIYTHNISNSYISAGGYQGIYGPGQSQGNNTIAHYFPDVTDANRHFHQNVFVGGDAAKYTNYNTISQNYFIPEISSVGFVDYTNGELDFHGYALNNTSNYFQAADDGSDLGVDFEKLDSAFTSGRNCSVVNGSYVSKKQMHHIKLFPNPVNNILFVGMERGEGSNYFIHDLTGRVLLSGVMSDSYFITTSDLQPGTYLFRIFIDGVNVNELFIVD